MGSLMRLAPSLAPLVVLSGVLSMAALAPATAPALSQAETVGVVMGTPSATGTFGEPIVFRTTLTSVQAPVRVELITDIPGGSGQRVSIAALEQTGVDRWEAVAIRAGHIVPNTAFDFRFRVVTPDGSILGPLERHRVDDTRIEWRRLEGDLVTVWWHRGDEGFAARALDIAESAVDSAAELLGVDAIEPVDFIIYSDGRTFREAMGPSTRENVGGQAHPAIRTLFGLISPAQISSDWVEELVVHELAHLVFDAAVSSPYAYPPRWLNEGLAVYLSTGYTEGDRVQVEGAARAGSIIPLDGLGGQFPTRPGRFGLAYAESVSAVDHFVQTFGEPRLVELITSFSDGLGLDEAFEVATGESFSAFDDAWLASLGAERPEPLGPQPAPPGNVPDAWESRSDALLR